MPLELTGRPQYIGKWEIVGIKKSLAHLHYQPRAMIDLFFISHKKIIPQKHIKGEEKEEIERKI